MRKYKNKDLWRKRISKAMRGRKFTEAARQAMSAAAKRRWANLSERAKISYVHMGRKLSAEHRANISKGVLESWKRKGCVPKPNAKPKYSQLHGCQTRWRKHPVLLEKRIKQELRKQHIRYRSQVIIGDFVVDILLPNYNIIIECDEKHHQSPTGRKRDAHRDRQLNKLGFVVTRITSEEIICDAAAAVRRLQL